MDYGLMEGKMECVRKFFIGRIWDEREKNGEERST